MSTYNFDEIIERKQTNCIKHDGLETMFGDAELQAFWVADMDFKTPDFIIKALKERLEHPILGYTYACPTYFETIQKWILQRHEWETKTEWFTFVPGIIKGIAYSLECFTKAGDKVIIQPPVYPPFHHIPTNMNRELVLNPLKMVDGAYQMDLEHLESIIDDKCKALILANPHNPGGMTWSKETLQKLAEICKRNGILVISDEIHAEMAHKPNKHTPFASVSEDAAACSITYMSPSKTFNIAGVVSSYAIVIDSDLRKKFFDFMTAGEFNSGNIFSYLATQAAYTYGESWLEQMMDYVQKNIAFVDDFCKTRMPQIKAYIPQSSFLVWLDCRELNLSQEELVSLFKNKARLALNDGVTFGEEGKGYMRLNVGCSKIALEKALLALENAIKTIG